MKREERRKRRDPASLGTDSGTPRLFVTYSDIVTLLLVFVILLFSFSKLDAKKFETALGSFRESLGLLQGGKTGVGSFLVFGGASRNMLAGGR